MKVAVIANTSWYVYNFRRNLMTALREAGHEPVVVAGHDDYTDKLRRAGFECHAVPFSGAGVNPLRELRTIFALRQRLRRLGANVALTYTPKGTIYTALALIGLRVRIIANISGLGRAFVRQSWLTFATSWLYRLTLRRTERVFFQNADDLRLFERLGLVETAQARLLPGSGVDLVHFSPAPSPETDERSAVRFLMVARLMWEKGVCEYVEAARVARRLDPRLHFALLGPPESSARQGASQPTLDKWVCEGVIEYLGVTDDVRPHLLAANCVVLPSYYREGVPRSLLEAAAMARPVVTTDAVGCRECVDDGITGYLCRPMDAQDLAQRLLDFAALSPEQRAAMGRAGRAKMEREFDERIVIQRYLEALVGPSAAGIGAAAS
ncbi:MAG: glycosyltransferase family 4 protein [Rubrivivax sp.]|nr:glycosyltransferase family 4 protein [Rubrivivax sp.]